MIGIANETVIIPTPAETFPLTLNGFKEVALVAALRRHSRHTYKDQ